MERYKVEVSGDDELMSDEREQKTEGGSLKMDQQQMEQIRKKYLPTEEYIRKYFPFIGLPPVNTELDNSGKQMDQQSLKRERETGHVRKEASSSSSKKSKNTTTSGKTPFVIDESNFSEFLATLPTPRPLPLPQRRSLRLSKYKSPYGASLTPMPPLPPELMRYLLPPKGSITERERQEARERFNNLPTISDTYDGFHLSANERAAYKAGRNFFMNPPPPPPPSNEDIAQLVNKLTETGLNREALEFGVPLYSNNLTKIKEFVDGFTRLREMGFPLSKVGEALMMCDRNIDQALAYINK